MRLALLFFLCLSGVIVEAHDCTHVGAQWRGGSLPRALAHLLDLRPHDYYPQASLDELSPLPTRYLPRERKHRRVLVHEEALPSLVSLIEKARHAGFRITVRSAFRDDAAQGALWEAAVHREGEALAAFHVAPPCFSEHATGRAVDLGLASVHQHLPGTPAARWLRRHAPELGWSLSFDEGDPDVTASPARPGVMAEPWHFHHVSLKQPSRRLAQSR